MNYMKLIMPMSGRIKTRRLDGLPKKANLIIMAWKTSDFLVLHEP